MRHIDQTVWDEMTRRLVATVDPDRLMLFRSRARGDARSDSDVDLLIIRESAEPRHRRVLAAYRALRGRGIPKDILWVTPAEVEEWRQITNHVITRGLREGKVLYDKNTD